MAVQQNRFAPPVIPRARSANRKVLRHVFSPVGGMNTSVPPHMLQPGETPYCENFIVRDGTLESRSGLSLPAQQALPSDVSYPRLIAGSKAVDGTQWDLVVATPGVGSYTTSVLTYGWSSDNTNLSSLLGAASSMSFFDWTVAYDSTTTENTIVAATGSTAPIHRPLALSSDWTKIAAFESVESSAHFVESFDERLLFYNTYAGESPHLRRVRWSVRGDPFDFTSEGAGFQDLLDMEGHGTGIHAQRDRLVLFSDKETWQALPRRDAYAFDFARISGEIGNPYPRTAAQTPVGVIWLGADYRFYRVIDGQVRVFTNDIQNWLRDRSVNIAKAFATYDSERRLYQFFYSNDANLYGTNNDSNSKYAFFLNVDSVRAISATEDKGVWMHQYLARGVGNGYENRTTGVSGGQNNVFFFEDTSFVDISNTILMPLAWTSHGINASGDPNTYEAINEITLDYSYDTASTNTFTTNYLIRSTQSKDFDQTSRVTGEATGSVVDATAGNRLDPIGYRTQVQTITPVATRYPQFQFLAEGISGAGYNQNFQGKIKLHAFHVDLIAYSGRGK